MELSDVLNTDKMAEKIEGIIRRIREGKATKSEVSKLFENAYAEIAKRVKEGLNTLK